MENFISTLVIEILSYRKKDLTTLYIWIEIGCFATWIIFVKTRKYTVLGQAVGHHTEGPEKC